MPPALCLRRRDRAFKDIAIIFVQGSLSKEIVLSLLSGTNSQRDIMMLYSMRGQCLHPLYARKSPYRDEPVISSSVIKGMVCASMESTHHRGKAYLARI
jgi:Na+-transporting NADH:ubiquinone oxidoreductase subunit NqrA